MFVLLENEDPFAMEDLMTCRNIRTRNKFVDTHIFKALEFILNTNSPFVDIWGFHGLVESGLVRIVRVDQGGSQFRSICFTESNEVSFRI